MSQSARRETLKRQLVEDRGDVCDFCGDFGATDMHEWLIKRSAVPKGRRQMKIFDERNCSLLHHACHMTHGQTKAMKEHLAEIFLERYGVEDLLEFVEGLGLRDTSHAQYIRSKQNKEDGHVVNRLPR